MALALQLDELTKEHNGVAGRLLQLEQAPKVEHGPPLVFGFEIEEAFVLLGVALLLLMALFAWRLARMSKQQARMSKAVAAALAQVTVILQEVDASQYGHLDSRTPFKQAMQYLRANCKGDSVPLEVQKSSSRGYRPLAWLFILWWYRPIRWVARVLTRLVSRKRSVSEQVKEAAPPVLRPEPSQTHS